MAFIYLASPYTHPDEKVVERRVKDLAQWVANYVTVYSSPTIYSPILHGHLLAKHSRAVPGTADFWERHNFGMILSCNELWVLKLPGWQQSVGIHGDGKSYIGEVKFAEKNGKRVRFKNPIFKQHKEDE